MKTQIAHTKQLTLAMFEFQSKKRWASTETIIRRASGRPEPARGNLKQAKVPESSRIVLRELIRCFSVDNNLRFKVNGVFNNCGFRKCGYRQFEKFLARRTTSFAITFLRDCGLITTFQEKTDDGDWGQWWIRLNADMLNYWAANKPTKPASSESSASANDCHLSSPQPGSEAVASQPTAVAPEEKKENSPSGPEFLSPKEAEVEARRIMMESPVGDVVRKLKGTVPGIDKLSIDELKTIQRWLNHSSSVLRLTPDLLNALERMLSEEFQNLDGPGLVAKWQFIAMQFAQWRLMPHDALMTDRYRAFLEVKDTLFSEKPILNKPEHFNPKHGDAGILNVRRLLTEMKEGGSSSLVALLAKLVGNFLRARPGIYKLVWDRVPQVRALCQISFECHNYLIKEAKQFESSFQSWNQIKGFFGFEHCNFVYAE